MTTAARTAQVADDYAAKKNAPASMASIANLIRYAKGSVGLEWVAANCEAQSKHQDNWMHAAQFRVIAKRLRRTIALEVSS